VRVRASPLSSLLWLQRRSRCALTPNARAIEVVDAYGQVRGMVAFDNATRTSVEAHMATDTPIAWRSLLPAAFQWAFEELDLRLMLGLIPASNHRARRLVEAAGFSEGYRVREGWAKDVDLVLYEMRKEDCRWLSGQRKVA
jgi:hypothetical protein